MKIDKLIAAAEKQEEILQFPHFNRQDAWGLGNELVKIILQNGYHLSVSIRLSSGLSVFQYMPEGTGPDNEKWMTKKFNVVRELEESSLLSTLRMVKHKQDLEKRGLDAKLHAWGGGGFPVKVRGTGLVGVFVSSGLYHFQDHELLVEAAAAYLKAGDVPRIPINTKI